MTGDDGGHGGDEGDDGRAPLDLRLVVLASAAWVGALAARLVPLPAQLAAAGVVLVVVSVLAAARPRSRKERSDATHRTGRFGPPVARRADGAERAAAERATFERAAVDTASNERHNPHALTVAALLVMLAVAAVADLRATQTRDGPVATLAEERAAVSVVGNVADDPRVVHERFGDQVVVRLAVHEVTGRGRTYRLHTSIVVLGDPAWAGVALGSTVTATGRLAPADEADVAGLLDASGNPLVRSRPGLAWRAAAAVRNALRASVAHRPAEERALVPALVDGDDADVPDDLADDFRTTGLTHLLAVSGTNLTLVVGFLLAVARWCRVRGRWLLAVGGLGIVGFVMLARTEPSVLRAAVMGTVGLVAMTGNGRARGLRGLAVAVIVLLLLAPGLATSTGFALSVLATLGILVLGPPWRRALSRWLPWWLAEAIAVPAAAQLACTPLVAAISGQISLVAVAANLAAGPLVGPATVSGLVGGLLSLVWTPLGRLPGTGASWCVAWIVAVAHHGAALPTAAIAWGTGASSLAVLVVLTGVVAALGPRLLRRRSTGLACCVLLLLVVCVRLPTPGWPPTGWIMAACDVGQGDGLVLDAGPGEAVVVDAGPDPRVMDHCLDRLQIRSVPLLLLTHFHADHVDGVTGVFEGRPVGAVETTRLADPPAGVSEVDDAARAAGLTPYPAPYGVTRTIGDVTLQVLWPLPDSPTVGPGDGSTANEASVVLLVEVRGVRLLLTGDVDPEGQEVLARQLRGLRVDVLKMPHHGSRYQDEDWLVSLEPRFVLVSVGADNDYGQPSADTLDPLAHAGADVLRTDQHGDLVVVEHGGRLTVRTDH